MKVISSLEPKDLASILTLVHSHDGLEVADAIMASLPPIHEDIESSVGQEMGLNFQRDYRVHT